MLRDVILPLLLIMGPPLLLAGLALAFGVDSRDLWSTHRWQEPRGWL
jgi:hypothetical protein